MSSSSQRGFLFTYTQTLVHIDSSVFSRNGRARPLGPNHSTTDTDVFEETEKPPGPPQTLTFRTYSAPVTEHPDRRTVAQSPQGRCGAPPRTYVSSPRKVSGGFVQHEHVRGHGEAWQRSPTGNRPARGQVDHPCTGRRRRPQPPRELCVLASRRRVSSNGILGRRGGTRAHPPSSVRDHPAGPLTCARSREWIS